MKNKQAIRIKVNKDQEEKLLELFEYYLPSFIEDKTTYPYFADYGIVVYSESSDDTIHWYELLSNVLIKEIFKTKQYWQNRYVVQCVELYVSTCEHPIDWVYDKHLKLINNIPLFRTSDEQLEDMMKESKKLKTKEKVEKEGKKTKEDTKPKKKQKEDEFFS